MLTQSHAKNLINGTNRKHPTPSTAKPSHRSLLMNPAVASDTTPARPIRVSSAGRQKLLGCLFGDASGGFGGQIIEGSRSPSSSVHRGPTGGCYGRWVVQPGRSPRRVLTLTRSPPGRPSRMRAGQDLPDADVTPTPDGASPKRISLIAVTSMPSPALAPGCRADGQSSAFRALEMSFAATERWRMPYTATAVSMQ